MTPKDLYGVFRSEMFDEVEPFLWSKTDVWGYLVDAQRMFCRLTDGLRDATSDITQLVIEAGEPWLELSEAILHVRYATLLSTGQKVSIISYGETGGPTPYEMTLSGPVRVAITDMEEGKLRLGQIPTAGDTLALIIERLPLSVPSETVGFEIREEHRRHLLRWMQHLAYAKEDSETLDVKRSADMRSTFEAYCAKAKEEKSRRNQKPRLITYGGL